MHRYQYFFRRNLPPGLYWQSALSSHPVEVNSRYFHAPIYISIDGRPAMSSPMNTLLLGLTMYDTLLIVTSVMMVGVPSIHTHSSYVIDTQTHDRSEKS